MRHRRNVQGVVGGAARGHQADDGVDDGFHIDDVGHDRLARLCELDATQRGGADEGFAQGRAGIDEGGAGQMEAHQLHHHLVGVGGAVEGAGACGVVGGGFSFEQLVARDLAECEELTDFRFFLVVDAGGHGAGWRENHGQVAEGQRADDEAGHDLVACAEHEACIERIVRHCDGGRESDHIAREQGQLHAGATLCDAIAHRGHASGDLRRGAGLAGRILDEVGIVLERLVGAQHVVVTGDDADIGRSSSHGEFVAEGRGGEGVGEVSAGQVRAAGAFFPRLVDAGEVGSAGFAAAFLDACGDFRDFRVKRHGVPRRSTQTHISAGNGVRPTASP